MKLSLFAMLIIVISNMSCNKHQNNTSNYLNEDLIPIDTTIIKEGQTLLGLVVERKIIGNYLILKDTSHPFYSMFDINTGNLIKEYSNKYVKNVVFPSISPNGFFISGDSVFILYSWSNKIFLLTKKGQYLKTIKLNYPNPDKLSTNITNCTFIFDSAKRTFIISSSYTSLGESRAKYIESTNISRFDIEGNFINTFGNYPKSYSRGNLFGGLYDGVYDNEYVYLLYSVGYPYIEKYNTKGKLVNKINNKGKAFNYRLNYFKGEFDPQTVPANDSYFNFVLDNSKDNQIFYMDYTAMKGELLLSGSDRYLLKHDIKYDTYSEHKIPSNLRLVSAKNNNIYMYSDSNEMHEILLIKYKIE